MTDVRAQSSGDLFADVPAWAATGSAPAAELAEVLRSAGLVAENTVDAPAGQPDPDVGTEWGWLGVVASADEEDANDDGEGVGIVDDDPAHADDTEPTSAENDGESLPGPGARVRSAILAHWRKAAVAAVTMAVLGGTLAAVLDGSGTEEQARDKPDPAVVLGGMSSATSGTVRSMPATAVGECPSSTVGKVTRGRGVGSQASGPDVILAFDYSYYVRRSGAAARGLVSPTAKIGDAATIQQAIDALPKGTTHCLTITETSASEFLVELAETRPGQPPRVYRQRMTTVAAAGKTWIADITKV